jgi:hypothetical protein
VIKMPALAKKAKVFSEMLSLEFDLNDIFKEE